MEIQKIKKETGRSQKAAQKRRRLVSDHAKPEDKLDAPRGDLGARDIKRIKTAKQRRDMERKLQAKGVDEKRVKEVAPKIAGRRAEPRRGRAKALELA